MKPERKYCSVCGEVYWFGPHQCKPLFLCTYQDEDDWTKIYARDAEEAAEKYCENEDQYGDAYGPDERNVLVRKPEQEEDEGSLYEVSVDFSPTYSACLIKEG
jgi:hypothetical protein